METIKSVPSQLPGRGDKAWKLPDL